MRIGLTYDLRDEYLAQGYSAEDVAELDRADTIDGIEGAIRALGFATDRIGHAKSLLERIAGGDRWDLVFNIAEGIRGSCRESQVPMLLELYDIPCTFSDSRVLAIALDKALTKRIVQGGGIPTPAFVEVRSPADLVRVDLPFPLFAKPVAEGSSKGISAESRIRSKEELRPVCSRLLDQFRQPVLVETYLPGREFTVGILGTGADARVLGVMEIRFVKAEAAETYSLFTKAHYETLVKYDLATGETEQACARIALEAWRLLGCRDAGRIDLRMDARGIPNFLEVNPLPGLNPGYSDLPILCGLKGMGYRDLIDGIIRSACRRYPQLAGYDQPDSR